MKDGRTIVVGDVHGCLEEVRELLLETVDVKEQDRVIFLGDLIDKGPDSAGVVAFAKSLNAICIMGNHEERALRWRRHEHRRKTENHYKNPMRSIDRLQLDQWAKIPDEHWNWIASWPVYFHINERWTAVHAGCLPDVDIEKSNTNDLLRVREVRCITKPSGYIEYKMAPLNHSGEPYSLKSGETRAHWTSLWGGPRNIIYGHYVWNAIHHTTHPDTGAQTLGIDTGCVNGGHLSAMIFCPDHMYAAWVEAHRKYADLWNSGE